MSERSGQDRMGIIGPGQSRIEEPLPVSGHQLLEDQVQHGAVQQWKCVDCGITANSVKTYLDSQCDG